ncbi:MAG: FAD-dependent oxidoreductase, partial [Pseudomonadota bacterium]
MRILVMGAGVIGVTTAYFLARDGHKVTIIDRQSEAAAEGSYANGGQLSYDFASPMATPDLLPKLPGILAGRDIGFQIQPSLAPSFLSWSLSFLKNALPGSSRENAEALTALAVASRDALYGIAQETGIDYHFRQAGKLVVYDSESAFEKIRSSAEDQGNHHRLTLTREQCLELEPSLRQRAIDIAGG